MPVLYHNRPDAVRLDEEKTIVGSAWEQPHASSLADRRTLDVLAHRHPPEALLDLTMQETEKERDLAVDEKIAKFRIDE